MSGSRKFPRFGYWDGRDGYYFKGPDISSRAIADEIGSEHFSRIELHLHYIPRIKRCADWAWPCEHEGEWHSHYIETKPGEDTAYTFAYEIDPPGPTHPHDTQETPNA